MKRFVITPTSHWSAYLLHLLIKWKLPGLILLFCGVEIKIRELFNSLNLIRNCRSRILQKLSFVAHQSSKMMNNWRTRRKVSIRGDSNNPRIIPFRTGVASVGERGELWIYTGPCWWTTSLRDHQRTAAGCQTDTFSIIMLFAAAATSSSFNPR